MRDWTFLTVATVSLLLALLLLAVIYRWVYRRLEHWREEEWPFLGIQQLEVLTANDIVSASVTAVRLVRIVTTVLIVDYYLSHVFPLFPDAPDSSRSLLSYLAAPARALWQAFVAYLPDLFSILAVALIVYVVLQFLRQIFRAIGRGMIVVHGFYADWAEPTYKMVRAGLMVVAFIEIFPRLPGSNSQFFGGISVFVGALVTIGSSGAIGNIMAGVVLIYTRAFQLGQTVAIGDDTGTVVEKNLLVTRLRTPTNEEVTIPNGVVLAKSVTNYSAFAKTEGLALRVAVNLGYAVDWRQAHELLLAAAQRAPDVLESPRSFVLQHSLDASSVKYVLSAYIDDASRMVTAQSDLHRHVLDAFREAGVEIMSPPVSVFRTEAGTATSGPPPHGS